MEKIEPCAGVTADVFHVKFPPNTEIFDQRRLTEGPQLKPLPLGGAAPQLNVTSWTDNRRRSLADYRGRVIVLYFWLACGEPCMEPLAVLEDLQKRFAG